MSQFEIVEAVYDSNTPVSKKKLLRAIDLHPSSVEAGIKDCLQKGYISKTEHGYTTSGDFTEAKLESIRPKTIEDLTSDE